MSLKPLRKTKTPPSKAANMRALAIMGVCGIMLAMVVAARQFSTPEEISAAPAAAEVESMSMPSAEPVAADTVTMQNDTKRSGTAKKTAAPQMRASTAITVTAPAVAASPASRQKPAATTKVTTVPAPEMEMVTFTGCLERDDDEFRLKEAAGENVPRARSWKSGFVKKNTATIELLDTNTLRLVNNAGHRVSVSGVLKEREMQVRSIQRLPGECN
jgi:cytoskeletal protein RodZ